MFDKRMKNDKPTTKTSKASPKKPVKAIDSPEKLISESELLRTITDNATVGLFMMDDKQECIFMNPAAEEITGFKLSELLDKTLHDFIHHTRPDGTPYPFTECPIDRALPKKKRVSGEETFVRKDGSFYSVGYMASPLVAGGKPVGTVIEIRDLTEEKQAQEALSQSESRYKAFIAHSSEGIWRFELEKPLPIKASHKKQLEHIFKYSYLAECNDMMAKMYGLNSAEELEGARLTDLMDPKEQSNIDYLTAFINSGYNLSGVESLEKDINGKDKWFINSLVGIEEDGHIVRAWGMQQDITKRKKAETEFLESGQRFRELADSMPQIVWVSNPQGDIEYVNKQWYRYTDAQEGDINIDWEDLIHPDDQQAVFEKWNQSVKNKTIFQAEARLKNSGGKGDYRWFLIRTVPIINEAGDVTQWYGTGTDIEDTHRTIRRKQQLEAKAANLAEQRAQLIAVSNAKDEFISLASHQLRTPATGVKQYLGMLREGFAGEVTEKQAALLERAYDSNERQITIVNDLLRVAQIDAGKVVLNKETTDLVDLVQDVLYEQHSKFAANNQKAVLEEPEFKKCLAYIDRDKIRMVIENLIDNASKYTPSGKNITVSIGRSGESVLVTVKDQGVGIPKESIESIFTKFTRLDNQLSVSAGGSGLGLYWVQKVMDLHGGSITVSSVVDEGSSFTISLPYGHTPD